ncbi:hypothetical protein Agabi119p4_1199 [Agaricus bisporus var. burnettii]|uniref:Uncharacterized protein n=1 Tax=Agaricus bisporus var. burnettii TaxID=192524 RepID=A0A8H7KM64_AGABI|nr:hypothetical protein Agabi119p4_1199 [Agaricus bisporus var. burnettii]
MFAAVLRAPLAHLWPFPSLADLFPPFLLAVPKKKVSHSRKAMRAANKGLKDKQNIPGRQKTRRRQILQIFRTCRSQPISLEHYFTTGPVFI